MTDYYTDNSERLCEAYDLIDPVSLHAAAMPAIAGPRRGAALDVGAGSGRDAAWLASLGYRVTACEPNAAMRAHAIRNVGAAADWLDCSLPTLDGVTKPGSGFDLVLCFAVMMHVRPEERADAVARMAELLARDGSLVLTFKNVTPSDDGRDMHPISKEEIASALAKAGLAYEVSQCGDVMGRSDIVWTTFVATKNKDAAGA